MKVLVIGSGGREHALLWKLKRSREISQLFCAPGNGGTSQIATNVPIDSTSVKELKDFSQAQKIDFTIVGPEVPLSLGIVDLFQKSGLSIFGVNQKASQLESSKGFSKKILQKYHIPTAAADVFESFEAASKYLKTARYPLVLKADGLASGKGVVICENISSAVSSLEMMMKKKSLGVAGEKMVIEEYLEGEEISYLGFLDGDTFLPLSSCQDHKKIHDGEKGPNTGGMGAYSPVISFTPEVEQKVRSAIIEPLLKALKQENIDYRGVLYIGLMMVKGHPYVLEFNVRFGDPETQALLFRLKSDLLPFLKATSDGNLKKMKLEWDPRPAVCVVMVAQGYPGAYPRDEEIFGLDSIEKMQDVALFHAGTVIKDKKVLTAGGRVLNMVARGKTYEDAIQKVYAAVNKVTWKNMYFRKDIGFRVWERPVCQKQK